MRRLAALLLILTSGWLLYQTSVRFVFVSEDMLSNDLLKSLTNPSFLLPLSGGLMGLLGGLIVFFGGAGGAAIAMIGGVLCAGFSLYIGQSFDFSGFRLWENQAVVGVAMLALAGIAAVMGRN